VGAPPIHCVCVIYDYYRYSVYYVMSTFLPTCCFVSQDPSRLVDAHLINHACRRRDGAVIRTFGFPFATERACSVRRRAVRPRWRRCFAERGLYSGVGRRGERRRKSIERNGRGLVRGPYATCNEHAPRAARSRRHRPVCVGPRAERV